MAQAYGPGWAEQVAGFVMGVCPRQTSLGPATLMALPKGKCLLPFAPRSQLYRGQH